MQKSSATYSKALPEFFSATVAKHQEENAHPVFLYVKDNHLGNVLVTLADRKLLKQNGSTIDYYMADVRSTSDYSAFGAPLPGRNANAADYRYGANGMEHDDENVQGDYSADYREYDSRLGRWLSKDPVVRAWESPYAGFLNNPIYYKDPSGLDPDPPAQKEQLFGISTQVKNVLHGHSDWNKANRYAVAHQLNEGSVTYGKESAIVTENSHYEEHGSVEKGDYRAYEVHDETTFSGTGDGVTAHIDSYAAINSSEDGGWYETATKANFSVTALGGVIEHSGSITRVGSNLKFYPSGWGGNGAVSTIKVTKVAEVAGKLTFAAGVIIDGVGVYNYYKYGANDPNAVHPAKAAANTAIGAWGFINPGTAIGATIYFGIDAFYPGGFQQAAVDQARLIDENKETVPTFNAYRDVGNK